MTLTTIVFIYGLIVLVIFMIAVINIQPLKKVAARYPSTDMVFYILLSLAYNGVTARDLARTEKYFFNSITLPFFVPDSIRSNCIHNVSHQPLDNLKN